MAVGTLTLRRLKASGRVVEGEFLPAGQASYQTGQLPPQPLGYSPFQLGAAVQTADPDTLENLLGEVDGTRCRWIDLDGEGLPGLLTMDERAWYYKRNISAWNPDGPPTARPAPLPISNPTRPSPLVGRSIRGPRSSPLAAGSKRPPAPPAGAFFLAKNFCAKTPASALACRRGWTSRQFQSRAGAHAV